MRRLLALALAAVVACTAPGRALAGADRKDPNPPHIHLTLIGYPEPYIASATDVTRLAKLITAAELDRQGDESGDNPLAPCSLLAGAFMSSSLNAVWGHIVQGSIPLPPRGTSILGMYDDELAGRSIPLEHPAKAADMLARLYIWYSWEINGEANTLLQGATQRQCLALLVSDVRTVGARISAALSDPGKLVLTHSPAVARFSAMLLKPDAERMLGEVRTEAFRKTASTATANPLAACSLLVALRLASRLNALWFETLSGTIPRDAPLPKEFSGELKDGSIPRDDPVHTAQLAAALFGSQIVLADTASKILTSDSSQEECLREIVHPGLIRRRLIREGKLPRSR